MTTTAAEQAAHPALKMGLPRVQLALNVSNVDEAVAFYSRIFGATPHKRRPGYANFALTSPPLKLVLFENEGAPGTLNHLGVEVAEISDVDEARDRISASDLPTADETDVVCCHATQDKVWVNDPDGAGWEFYTITDDLPDNADPVTGLSLEAQATGACCSS